MAAAKVLVFVFFCVGVRVMALTGKAYFCRDPDTGKLYAVNSTWPSSSFCGNYTCKLRKKISTATNLPLREFNVSELNVTQRVEFQDLNNIPLASQFENDKMNINDLSYSKEPREKTEQANIISKILQSRLDMDKDKKKPEKVDNGDRYLTTSEIKTISELLHNVKKSDLEVIVDIYSLAQDIYKEMDKMTSENILEETLKSANTEFVREQKQPSSYWYEPLHKHSAPVDMELQGSNTVTSTQHIHTALPKSKVGSYSYFTGPLSRSDFGSLPYYYPMSYFQRQSSYVNPTHSTQYSTTGNYRPPNNVKTHVSDHTRLGMPYVQPNMPCAKPKPPPAKNQNPPALLPYPFSYIPQHYNTSSFPFDFYFKTGPWLKFQENTKDRNQMKPQIEGSQIPDNKIPTIPDGKTLQTSRHIKEQRPVVDNEFLTSFSSKDKPKHKSRADWQTDPISAKVIEEVRALFQEKGKLVKPMSLRKKIKLERVGKVFKLDEGIRDKRDIKNQEKELDVELEAYPEKTTCLSDIQPGFFRMGNLTEPFPACCPQRIDDDAR